MQRPKSGAIRKIRKTLGMTTTEFAAEIGVSESTIRSWENGKRNPAGLQLKSLLNAISGLPVESK